ncbi:hypothetical protein AB0Q95_12930 [Streptomyces sp. NPDC059900]|uniref:hypothetical protein n=1 Tax=Streptomyces sp. NPDC059900 TaxID=3155816 RepID=UPI0034415BE6
MTDEEFDEVMAQIRAEVLQHRFAPPPPTEHQENRDDDTYAVRARHAEFGACAH